MNIYSVGTFLFISTVIIVFTYLNYSNIYDYLVDNSNVNFIKTKMVDIDNEENEKMKKENPTYFEESMKYISEKTYNILNYPNVFFYNMFQYLFSYI
jgi:hypothetical protein